MEQLIKQSTKQEMIILSDAISEHLFFKIFLGYTPSPPQLFLASSASELFDVHARLNTVIFLMQHMLK